MASLGVWPTFDFEADLEVLKMMRASTRATKLHIKRVERARGRDARDWTWGKGIEDAKPHHSIRAAARTCLARGVVEAQEDMPSIVRMSNAQAKGTRRKPAVSHMVHGAQVVEGKALLEVHSALDDVETTADEGCDGFETESPQESPAFGPHDAPSELQDEHMDWPALPLAAADAAPAAAEESRPSHREVALRFAEESLEEQAAAERRCAKKAAVARAMREASMWRPSWRKRPRMQAKARSARVQARTGDLPRRPAPVAAASSDDFEAGVDIVKMARAATRHRSLHIKRSELSRARGARDWTWGKGIEGARPHHFVRAAARTCLAKGTIESQEDMPSIVRMSKPGDKGRRRKPAIAHAV